MGILNRNERSLLDAVVAIADDAGRVLLEHYGRVQPELKEDRSPVTAADRAASALIGDRLRALDTGIPVVCEEAPDSHSEAAHERFWAVDPLDGTKEFLKHTGEFTVNIALIEDGQPVLGVVYVPVHARRYFALRGAGAFRSDGDAAAAPIAARAAADPLAVVASRDHAGPRVAALLERLPTAQTLSMGSSLKFCLVAEGRADLYLRDVPTREWDTAAAQCVVECAGGVLLDLATRAPLAYGKPGYRNGAILTIGDPRFPWTDHLI